MRLISAAELHSRKVGELGLDASALDLTATESLAAALRRAAGFLCPCSMTTLVRAIVRPLEGLVPDLDAISDSVETTLEAMVAHGDLLEQRDVAVEAGSNAGVLLYAAPPSFVVRQSGAALLLGITPDELSPLSTELEARIEYANHIRRLPADTAEDLHAELLNLGLVELSVEAWLKAPPAETAKQHVARVDRLLDTAAPSGMVPGLTIIDPSLPVRYYRGRWAEPRSQTGRFVGRRSQAYGAALWCYFHISNGTPASFIELPLVGSRARGCDEAWRLQMAIDALRGEPQRVRLRPGPAASWVLEFFSPVPMWAQRRWDAVGEPVPSTGCLFAYRFSENEIAEELHFIRERLWLDELTPGVDKR
jgi:hypothetical protein